MGWARAERFQQMNRFRRILVATDFTPASTAALKEALELAKADAAELLIAHAYRPPNVIQAESVRPGVYAEWDQNLRTKVEGDLWPLVVDARGRLINARPLALPGIPYKAIAKAAREYGVDLIVMGTHCRNRLSRFFKRSVATRVISAAPCPVMVVRAPLPDKPRGGPKEAVRQFPASRPFRRRGG